MKNEKEFKGAVLALDIASRKTGFAIFRNNKIEKSGTWKLNQDAKFHDLYSKVREYIKEYKVTTIIVEDIFKDNRKQAAFNTLSQCRGVIMAAAESKRLTVTPISPIRIKQHVWNMRYNQNLSREKQKEAMIRAVKKLGYTLESDNADDEADAIGLMITYIEDNFYTINHPEQTE